MASASLRRRSAARGGAGGNQGRAWQVVFQDARFQHAHPQFFHANAPTRQLQRARCCREGRAVALGIGPGEERHGDVAGSQAGFFQGGQHRHRLAIWQDEYHQRAFHQVEVNASEVVQVGPWHQGDGVQLSRRHDLGDLL